MLSCIITLFLWLALDATNCFSTEAMQRSRPRKSRSQAKVTAQALSGDEKKREEIHTLILNGKYQREDVAKLWEIGNRSSIPALIKVLEDHPSFVRDNGRVVIPLETIYAIEALRKISGLNMGATYQEWSEWWAGSKQYYLPE